MSKMVPSEKTKSYSEVKLFAFWEYDHYPYLLGDKISRIGPEGRVYADAYQGWFKPVAILQVEEGQALWEKLEALRDSYRKESKELLEAYRVDADALTKGLIP